MLRLMPRLAGMGSCDERMMLADDRRAARWILNLSARVAVLSVVASTESVAKIAEDHHDVKFALPVFLLLLQTGGF